MAPDAGDVMVAPFPFSDLPVSKTRPILVLSSAKANEACGSTLAAMITTGAHSSWQSDVPIRDWRSAGLRSPCVVRFKLFTLDNRLIPRRIGVLAADDRAAVRAAARSLISI